MRPAPEEKFTPFMTALCFGRIEEDLILPYPTTQPKDAELLKNVLGSIGQVLRPHEKDFRAWDRAGDLPASFIEELQPLLEARGAAAPVLRPPAVFPPREIGSAPRREKGLGSV